MAGEYVFNLTHLSKQYDNKTVLDDITLAFSSAQKLVLLAGTARASRRC